MNSSSPRPGPTILSEGAVAAPVQAWIIVVVIALALLGVMLLPLRNAWNADGSDDRLREEEE